LKNAIRTLLVLAVGIASPLNTASGEIGNSRSPLSPKINLNGESSRSDIVRYEYSALNRLVFVVKNGSNASARNISQQLAAAGFKVAERSLLSGKAFTLEVSQKRLEEAQLLLEALAEVEYVEQDYSINIQPNYFEAKPLMLQEELGNQALGSYPSRSGVPWNIDRLDQIGPQLDNRFSFTLTGKGVDVYVLDTGVRETHTEFAGMEVRKLSAFGGEFTDCDGHGTHVAATAVGRSVGVATGARLVDFKIFGGPSCAGTISNLIAALTHIRDNHDYSRRAVINMSVSVPFSSTVNTHVLELHQRGILSVVSSGNNGTNSCTTSSPSSAPSAITVNASDIQGGTDDDAWFSNYGPCTDIYAPGVDIYSADRSSTASYSLKSGTSMAAPLVAGVVAAILEANPNASSDLISQKLLNTALPVDFLPGYSDAKKFIQFGPALTGYFPLPADYALGFLGESKIQAKWRHSMLQNQSILPVDKLGVEILAQRDAGSPVVGACSVASSVTECMMDVSTVATSYYLRTTTLTQGYLKQSSVLVDIDDYREHNKEGPWVELSVGSNTACGIDKFQDLYCWGDRVNSSTGLINTSGGRSFAPVLVPSVGKVKYVEVAPSNSVCVITSSDRLYCWGTNLGNIVDNSSSHVANPKDMGITNLKKVVLGNSGRACAINLSNSLYCWGRDLGISGNLSAPRLISTSVADVSIGAVSYCRVNLNSTQVTCAGSNHRGQLGNDTLSSSTTGTLVVGLSGKILKLESSDDVTCALNESNELYCWGWNDGFGTEPLLSSSKPKKALLISTGAKHVSLDFYSLCITQASTERIACMGRTSILTSGLSVTGPTGNASFKYLSQTAPPKINHELGSESICSLTTQGRILCQGSGGFGVIAAASRVSENSLSQVASAPFPVEVTKTLSSYRIQGVNRYATAVEISKSAFPGQGVRRVFIASGVNFPDALSAGPVAATLNAPLLLTRPDFLPQDVILELERLSPLEIIILGSVAAVSKAVEDQLVKPGRTVIRIGGSNRYETSVLVSQLAFQTADTVFIATGQNFPDALAGTAVASISKAPLVLLPGQSTTIVPVVASYLSNLQPKKIFVLGGPATISNELVSALSAYGDVERLSGVNRIETSIAISKRFFSSAQTGIISFGWNFPDALAGSMLASKLGIPIFLSSHNCVRRSVINEVRRLGANSTHVLGGEATLSGQIAQLFPCD
jgi:putative cell wall-binding protein/alpha-tubulin suppressor-like RCC1 family protein